MAEIRRPDNMERITTPELAQAFIDEQIALARRQIGSNKVLLALSGGVDSSVVAALLIKAVGKQLVCVHVNHGRASGRNRSISWGFSAASSCRPSSNRRPGR